MSNTSAENIIYKLYIYLFGLVRLVNHSLGLPLLLWLEKRENTQSQNERVCLENLTEDCPSQ